MGDGCDVITGNQWLRDTNYILPQLLKIRNKGFQQDCLMLQVRVWLSLDFLFSFSNSVFQAPVSEGETCSRLLAHCLHILFFVSPRSSDCFLASDL